MNTLISDTIDIRNFREDKPFQYKMQITRQWNKLELVNAFDIIGIQFLSRIDNRNFKKSKPFEIPRSYRCSVVSNQYKMQYIASMK